MLLFHADELRHFAERVFVTAGTEPAQAAIVVDHLINANLTGHDSHGVQHIPGYVGSILRGTIRAWTFGA